MARQQLEQTLLEMGFEADPMAKNRKNRTDFGYLLEMPLSRLTAEEMHRLAERKARRDAELEAAKQAEWRATWHSELDRLAAAIRKKSGR
uniref:Uncharacterized protein n=1 Tax=Caenorhabditis japonica TaxID=281687 RepID=A0A8R1IXH3_CAEJA